MASDTGLTYAMPLEVYLQAGIVRGVLVTNRDRLSNHLIMRKGEEVFSLRDATLETFDRKPVKVGSDEYMIYMQEVHLIADLSPQELTRRRGVETFYVQKETSKALISVGPYLLQGNVHMFPGSALHDLLLEKNTFFPVTDATLLNYSDIAIRTYLVNRTRIGLMTAISEGLTEL